MGIYGGCRVIDVFFVEYYGRGGLPRRVRYFTDHEHAHEHAHGDGDGNDKEEKSKGGGGGGGKGEEEAEGQECSVHFLRPRDGEEVVERAESEGDWPNTWADRASWAAELVASMRGAGFTWTSADVRHTRHTWRPSVRDRLHSIFIHVGPVLLVSWAVIRDLYTHYLSRGYGFDDLSYGLQACLTTALGAFLMAAFSLGHSAFAIVMAPLRPHPLSYFPPLYSRRVWEVRSVREFWSFGWHRLFSRLFLVYGVWPGEWLERKLMGKSQGQSADVGKVIGGFLSSAFVHSFAGHTVVPGGWRNAGGEAWFFAENGVAVVMEEVVRRIVLNRRQAKRMNGEEEEDAGSLQRWYDGVVGRIWWIVVLLYTGRNFARGWVLAGLVREMAFA